MCGIVGLVSNYTNGFIVNEADAFTEMLVIDSFRGLDSTGVFGVDNIGNVGIMKEASHGLNFVLTPDYRTFKTELIQRGLLVVGHNRAATRGTVNDRNAHPFWVDDKIVLVQNGTVRGGHKDLAKGSANVEVDSEAIAHVLSEEPDIAKALQKIDSGYALVWYNTETKCLYLIRNHERPLFYVDGQNTGMLFASEVATLEYVIKRNKLNMKEIKELEPYHLMTIKIDKKEHYTRTIEKIDAAYVWRGAQSGARFHRTYPAYAGFGGYDYECDNVGIWRPKVSAQQNIDPDGINDEQDEQESAERSVVVVDQRSARHDYTPVGKFDLKVDMDDYATKFLNEYHLDPGEVPDVFEQVLASKNLNEKQYVELYDYVPANSHAECMTWHVLGSLVVARDEIKALVYWTMHNKNKEEITNYVAESFYEVKVNRWEVRRFFNKDGVKKAIVKAYGMSPQAVIDVQTTVVKEENTNAAPQVH
jgi:hypothetical protein